MIGERFSRLVVISLDHKDRAYRKYYLCKCDCGREKVIQKSLISSGNTKSCGCLSRETGITKRKNGDEAVRKQILLGYKRHAKDRGFSFEIGLEEFSVIINKHCHYCDLPPSNIRITRNFTEGYKYSGIDRIDSSLGYIATNLVPSCKLCNYAKRDLTPIAFREWIMRLIKHNAFAS